MNGVRCLLAVTSIGTAVAGCTAADHDHSPATRPAVATDADPARATPEFWLAQTPTRPVTGSSFDRLWDACIDTSEDYLFAIDRRDRRAGVLTTSPMVSAQFFEPWRRELQTAADVAQSSVATVRRTIYWQFTRDGEAYTVVPKVLIERESVTEQRISGVLSRASLRPAADDKIYGNRETDRGLLLPATYFYPVGRDFAFEQRLADELNERLAAVAAR